MNTKKTRHTRPVIRVDKVTLEVVRFSSVKDAQNSIGGRSLSMALLTNKPVKGYIFYYEEDWKECEADVLRQRRSYSR